jgi:glutathionyl-hydroquinone reductase
MRADPRAVDIVFAITGCKESPSLPLREELNTNGFEMVYNAKGVGEAAVEKEKRKKEKELLKQIKSIERKLEKKKSYRRSKMKRRAMKSIREFRKKLEHSTNGITYEVYLEELRLRQEASELALTIDSLQEIEDKRCLLNDEYSEDLMLAHTSHIENQFKSALECMSEADFHSLGKSSNDSSIISMSSFGDFTSEDRTDDSYEERIHNYESDDNHSDVSPVRNGMKVDASSICTKTTVVTESTVSASNVHNSTSRQDIDSKTNSNTVRFKDVKPTTQDKISKARLLIDQAKNMHLSFSGESNSVASSGITDDQLSTDDSSEEGFQNANISERTKLQIFAMDQNRYHLLVYEACPWSHRVLITRALKGLEKSISVTRVPCSWDPLGFDEQIDRPMTSDTSCWSISIDNSCDHYSSEFKEFFTNFPHGFRNRKVPILWDSRRNMIISDKANEIMRILNSEFNAVASRPDIDIYQSHGKVDIDSIDSWLEKELCVAIYRCSQSTGQDEYSDAIDHVTTTLDKVEKIVKRYGFLCGGTLTAPDIRLFCVLMRFDEVYRLLFKINSRRISDMPALMEYTRDIYNIDGVKDVCDLKAIKKGYFGACVKEGQSYIVPRGGIFMKILQS